MEFTFLMLHNLPVMILARDEASPMKINKREAAWALIPLSSENFTYKNNQTSPYSQFGYHWSFTVKYFTELARVLSRS